MNKFPIGCIMPKYDYAIGSQIRNEPIIGAGYIVDHVTVRLFLTIVSHTSAYTLVKIGHRFNLPMIPDRVKTNASSRVVYTEQPLSGLVETEMARVNSTRRLLALLA